MENSHSLDFILWEQEMMDHVIEELLAANDEAYVELGIVADLFFDPSTVIDNPMKGPFDE